MSRRFDRRQFATDDKLPYITGTNDNPVELAALGVHVHVTGLFAETTQVFELHNPNDRPLEGNLVLPMPDDAVVCGYAIDVEGQLVDGVVVPKEEARRILEAEIRKGVDPGLVEQVQGNVYRTRIYPLPARGSRTVKVVYISRLDVDGADAAYHLPLGHARGVDRVSVRVEVSQTPVAPALVGSLGNLTLAPFDQRWVAEAELDATNALDDLQIRLPQLPPHLTMVEQFAGDEFFCISSIPQRATAMGSWNPRRIAILWDSSGSRRQLDKDIGLLHELAKAWRHVTVDVRILRDQLDPRTHTFIIDDADCSELTTFLENEPRDGATYLAGVDFAATPHPDVEAWLVFSDGLGTIGTGIPVGRSPRVFTINSQTNNDSALLRHLAARSGGGYFNLVTMTPGAVANALSQWSDELRVARTAGCEDVHVTRHEGRLTVCGRLTQQVASVSLEGPGAPADQLSIARDSATDGRNLARAWAGQHAQFLQLLGSDEEQVVALGRRFGLVTPGTSLLVLETLDQHLEYDVEPPATRPAMREAFQAHRQRVELDRKSVENAHLGRVVSLWNARVAWWETDFSATVQSEPEPPKGGSFSSFDESDVADEGADFARRQRSMPAPGASMSLAAPEPRGEMQFESADSEEAPYDFDDDIEADEFEHGDSAKKEASFESARAAIRIQAWSADTPYLHAMREAGVQAAYDTYLAQRADYDRSPAFFLDCADHLLTVDQRALGLRVLSNLLELALDDPPLLRMYAWRMQREGELDRAIEVFERVRQKRDDEPQSHRDLALALEQRWQGGGNAEDATRAMHLLWDVVRRTWDRFPEIEIIALMELNRLIHLTRQAGIETPSAIDERLIKLLDLDVRISMSWDADLTDVDLHVFEPNGEHAYYGHNRTASGGLVSLDFRQGYGPEEYVLRKAQPGDYTIKTHYYGSHQQTLTGACTVIVNVFTNYGRPTEERQVLTLRLEHASDQVTVGTINIG